MAAEMNEGAYSSKFRRLQKEHMQQCRKETEDLNARNQRLHLETARRCRSMALRKKQHAEREEKLRQTILDRRRQELQEVTNRFQRLGRRTSNSPLPNSFTEVHPVRRGGGTPTLDEALQVVLGHSRPFSAFALSTSPAATSDVSRHGRPVSAATTSVPTYRSSSSKYPSTADVKSQNNIVNNVAQQNSVPMDFSVEHRPSINGLWKPSASIGPAEAMREDSLHNLTNSRGLFEQRLTEHQRTIEAQHLAALNEISNAVQDLAGKKSSGHVTSVTSGDRRDLAAADSLERDSTAVISTAHSASSTSVAAAAAAGNYPRSYHYVQVAGAATVANTANGVGVTPSAQISSAAVSTVGPSGETNVSPSGFSTYRMDATKNASTNPSSGHNQSQGQGLFSAPTAAGVSAGVERRAVTISPVAEQRISPAATTSSAAIGGSAAAELSFNTASEILPPSSGFNGSSSSAFFLHRANSASPVVGIVQPNVQYSTGLSTFSASSANQAVGDVTEPASQHKSMGAGPPANQVASKNSNPPLAFAAGDFSAAGAKITPDYGDVKENAKNTDLDFRNKRDVAMTSHPVSLSAAYVPETVAYVGHVAATHVIGSAVGNEKQDFKSDLQPAKPLSGFAAFGDQQSLGSSKAGMQVNSTTATAAGGGGELNNNSRKPPTSSRPKVTSEPIALKDINTIDDIPIDDSSSVSSLMSDAPAAVRSNPLRTDLNSNVSKSLLKGILKKRPSSVPTAGLNHNSDLVQPGLRLGSGGPTRSGVTSSSLRDSLEVAKSHLLLSRQVLQQANEESKLGKKSVRFAEVLCEEEPMQVEPISDAHETMLFCPTPPQYQRPRDGFSGGWRAMRPSSAKVISTTPPVDPGVKVPRVASAGMLRRTSFQRAAKYPYATPASGRVDGVVAGDDAAVALSAGPKPTAAGPSSTVAPSVNVPNNTGPAGGADGAGPVDKTAAAGSRLDNEKYMIDGIRVDRTPTDDEINWLWEKVRSCLSSGRNSKATSTPSEVGGDGGVVNGNVASSLSLATTAAAPSAVSSKPPIGPSSTVNVLAAQGRSATSLTQRQAISSTYVNNYMGSGLPASKQKNRMVTMETLSGFARRPASDRSEGTLSATDGGVIGEGGLLQQRRALQQQQFPSAAVANDVAAQQSTTFVSRISSAPATGRMGQENRLRQSVPGVTESMAGFLAAESLCQQTDVTESTVARAMLAAEQKQYFHHNNNNNSISTAQASKNGPAPVLSPKVPSALSIEEQRVLQSLERIDQKIQENELAVAQIGTPFIPRPPAFNSGFRGHQPRLGIQRRPAVAYNGSIPRHYFQQGPEIGAAPASYQHQPIR